MIISSRALICLALVAVGVATTAAAKDQAVQQTAPHSPSTTELAPPPPDGVTTCSIPNPDQFGTYHELIVGRYIDGAPLGPGCSCTYPGAKQPDCHWECTLKSDYTSALRFEKQDGKIVWIAVTAKQAELRTLAGLLEKGHTYRFCAYIPNAESHFGNIALYRFHPIFTPRKISGDTHGK